MIVCYNNTDISENPRNEEWQVLKIISATKIVLIP